MRAAQLPIEYQGRVSQICSSELIWSIKARMTQIEKIEKVRLASDVVCLVAVLLTHSAPPLLSHGHDNYNPIFS